MKILHSIIMISALFFNVTLLQAQTDTDGDGIADLYDLFPNDPSKSSAYAFVFMDSPIGMHVGGGRYWRVWAENISELSVAQSSNADITFSFPNSDPENLTSWWLYSFATQSDIFIEPGEYNETTTSALSGGSPILKVAGDASACNIGVGSFIVYETKLATNGDYESFAADFDYSCQNGASVSPAMHGILRVNSDVPVIVDDPSIYTDFDGDGLNDNDDPDNDNDGVDDIIDIDLYDASISTNQSGNDTNSPGNNNSSGNGGGGGSLSLFTMILLVLWITTNLFFRMRQ